MAVVVVRIPTMLRQICRLERNPQVDKKLWRSSGIRL